MARAAPAPDRPPLPPRTLATPADTTMRPLALAALLGGTLAAPVASVAAQAAPTASPRPAVAAHPAPVARPAALRPTVADADLTAVRAATERFRDVRVALAEGYLRDPGDLCDTAEMMGKPAALGAMGIHFFRPDLLGITGPPNPRVTGTGTHTDFRQPAILIYEPQADGSLELVAVENLVFRDAWHRAGHAERPSYQGVPWDEMADDPATPVDEAHLFAPHYDRHVWLYRENPNGMFAPFNPNVSCRHHRGATTHAH